MGGSGVALRISVSDKTGIYVILRSPDPDVVGRTTKNLSVMPRPLVPIKTGLRIAHEAYQPRHRE